MPKDNGRDIVRLVTAPNPMQAHIWRQALESEGIRCRRSAQPEIAPRLRPPSTVNTWPVI